MTTAELRAKLKAKLAESGLDLADAKKLHLELCQQQLARRQFGIDAEGFVIPYFDQDGSANGICRFRVLKLHGWAALAKEKIRYRSEKGSKLGIYAPPLGVNWKEYLQDASKPLVLTEGELKAAAATKAGIPTLGLSGVDCFRQGGQLLPAFSEIKWEARLVYIAYDSDAATNPNVARAENALARELLNLGARPYIARIPALCAGKKTAVDDFLVMKGGDALLEILKQGVEYQAAAELFALNEKVLYVADPGLILRVDTMQRMSCRAFTDHAYSTRIYHERHTNAKGDTKTVEKSAAKEWLKWPYRATVKKVTYAPGDPRITSQGEFNCWPGWVCEPKRGTVEPWNQLLDHLFGNEKAARKWFEQWLAYPLQHPGTKLYSAAVLWGRVQGTGKSLIGYSMFRIYGGNATEIGEKHLHGNHNEWAENKQFVMADEIASGGDWKRRTADQMKSMITQKQLRLNPKYIPSYTVPDCINYYFTSNHPDCLHLEDEDRRLMIHEVIAQVKPGEFYKGYMEWLDNGGASALFYHLQHLDLKGFNPAGHALITDSKREMISLGRSDVGDWVAQLRETPDTVLKHRDVTVHGSLFSTEELYEYFSATRDARQVTKNGLSRTLKQAGFQKVNQNRQIQGKKGEPEYPRLWAIRNREEVLKLSQPNLHKLYTQELEARKGKL